MGIRYSTIHWMNVIKKNVQLDMIFSSLVISSSFMHERQLYLIPLNWWDENWKFDFIIAISNEMLSQKLHMFKRHFPIAVVNAMTQ